MFAFLHRIFTCPFRGHEPEKFLTETDFTITTKRCKYCKQPLGIGHWKHLRQFVPPWLSKEKWDLYCDEKEQEIRNSCQ